jgi:hypothetical protein
MIYYHVQADPARCDSNGYGTRQLLRTGENVWPQRRSVAIKIPKPAQNTEAARKLWKISEQLTGAAWPLGELSRPALLKG